MAVRRGARRGVFRSLSPPAPTMPRAPCLSRSWRTTRRPRPCAAQHPLDGQHDSVKSPANVSSSWRPEPFISARAGPRTTRDPRRRPVPELARSRPLCAADRVQRREDRTAVSSAHRQDVETPRVHPFDQRTADRDGRLPFTPRVLRREGTPCLRCNGTALQDRRATLQNLADHSQATLPEVPMDRARGVSARRRRAARRAVHATRGKRWDEARTRCAGGRRARVEPREVNEQRVPASLLRATARSGPATKLLASAVAEEPS